MAAQTNQYLECVIETNPDALNIATALDNERRNGKVRGPLHGVPVLVKDVSHGVSWRTVVTKRVISRQC